MTILNFVMSDLWHFIGTVILLCVVFNGLASIINAIR